MGPLVESSSKDGHRYIRIAKKKGSRFFVRKADGDEIFLWDG